MDFAREEIKNCYNFETAMRFFSFSNHHFQFKHYWIGKMNAVQTHMHGNETVKDLLIKLYTQRMSSSRVIIKLKFTRQWERTRRKRRNKMHLPILFFVRFFYCLYFIRDGNVCCTTENRKSCSKKRNERSENPWENFLEANAILNLKFKPVFSLHLREQRAASWMPTSKNALEPH